VQVAWLDLLPARLTAWPESVDRDRPKSRGVPEEGRADAGPDTSAFVRDTPGDSEVCEIMRGTHRAPSSAAR
jgi:hypothetical protein